MISCFLFLGCVPCRFLQIGADEAYYRNSIVIIIIIFIITITNTYYRNFIVIIINIIVIFTILIISVIFITITNNYYRNIEEALLIFAIPGSWSVETCTQKE